MIRMTLFILCALILQNDLAAQTKTEKSSKVKFGGKLPFRNEPFVFESGEFTYVAGGDLNLDASKLVFKIAKFNKELKCIQKMKFKYKRNDNFYSVGYRYLISGKYLSFFYSKRTNENTKVYSQKINLEKMEFEGSPKLLLDLKCNDDWYNRKISCLKSPDGNFMLLVVSGQTTQAQYLFDNKEDLVYTQRNELNGYKFFVSNEGMVVGIMDVFDIDKQNLLSSVYKSPELKNQKNSRFKLLFMDKNGKPFYKDFDPEANIYYRQRLWTKYTTYGSYNSVTTSASLKFVNQLSYKYKLINNTLYFVSFMKCEKDYESTGFDYSYLCNGIFVSKFDITDNFKNTGKSIITFTKEQTDNLLEQTFSFNKPTMSERIKEVKNIETCNGIGFPALYMDWIDVDQEGNLSIFGSSYTSNNTNIYKKDLYADDYSLIYERRNYHYFRIGNKNGLIEEMATASMFFMRDMFIQKSVFLKHTYDQVYTAFNQYKSLELDPKKTNHDNSQKLKFNDGIETYLIMSESGQLYRIVTKNMDVVLLLYRISS